MLVQRQGGEGGKACHGHRRPQDIEQLHRGHPRRQRLAVRFPVLRDQRQGTAGGGMLLAGLFDLAPEPELQPLPCATGPQVAQTHAATTLDQSDQLGTALPFLLTRQGDPRPVADRAGIEAMQFVQQDDLAVALPNGQSGAPLLFHPGDQGFHPCRTGDVDEECLALAMGGAVQALDAAFAKERLAQLTRRGSHPAEALFAIEQLDRRRAAQADSGLQQQARGEDIAVQAFTAIADEGIAFAQQCQAGIEAPIARNERHVDAPEPW